jgi:hypothetical protein
MPLTKIQSLGITDGTIVNADINASAAIANTKLSAGAVLQVVSATDSTQRNIAGSTFITGSNTLSVSITPSSASNKIFIITTGTVQAGNNGNDTILTIFRGATNLGNGNNGMGQFYNNYTPFAMSYLDSPSTTSATTYQVYARVLGGTNSINTNGATGSLTAFEIKG